MRKRMVLGIGAIALAAGAAGAPGQSSPGFRLEGNTFNQGGRPAGGVVAQSASFRITLDAVGETVPALAAAGASFDVLGGTAGVWAPPVEVEGLALDAPGFPAGALSWAPARGAVLYNLYRGDTGSLPGTFGACLTAGVATNSHGDPGSPAPGMGYFYLVTGENRLGEEGTKGRQSNGDSRTSAPACP